VEEYKQLTSEGENVVQNALRALEQVSANDGHSTPGMVASFEHAVQRLQVGLHQGARPKLRRDSRRRGDAYFACWSESIANIKRPESPRPRVDRSRPRTGSVLLKNQTCFSPGWSRLRSVFIRPSEGARPRWRPGQARVGKGL